MQELMDVGDGMVVALIAPDEAKPQAINARRMKPDDFKRLTANIAQRGQLESLPYCALSFESRTARRSTEKVGSSNELPTMQTTDSTGDRAENPPEPIPEGRTSCSERPEEKQVIEIVSGHHRIQAAREAGLESIHVLLDKSGLSRDEITAKQIVFHSLETDADKLHSGLMQDSLFIANFRAVPDPESMPVGIKTIRFNLLSHQLDMLKAEQDVPSLIVSMTAKAREFADAIAATKGEA